MTSNVSPSLTPSQAARLEQLGWPSVWARDRFGVDLYDWQAEVMNAFHEPCWLALRTCNESGKTSHVIAHLVLWHMATFPGSLTITTSGSNNQIEHQLYPNLKAYTAQDDAFRIMKNKGEYLPTKSRLVSYSTDDAGRAEGWHKPPKIPQEGLTPGNNILREFDVSDELWRSVLTDKTTSLLMIIDEAKTVDQDIWLAWERCRPPRFLVASSPGAPMGSFYDCFHGDTARWLRYHVGYQNCPHLSKDPATMRLREHQIKVLPKDFIASAWDGEFMESGELQVFDAVAVDRAMSNLVPFWGRGQKRAALDLANGGDEVCLYVRDGNEARLELSFHDTTNDEHVVRECIRVLKREEIQPEQVCADDGGLGKVILNNFARKGWNLRRINFSAKARQPELYRNVRAEMYFELANRVANDEARLPRDPILKEQLMWQIRKFTEDGGPLQLIPKKQMPGSPDRADTVAMLYYDMPAADEFEERREQLDRAQSKTMFSDEQLAEMEAPVGSGLWDW